MHRIIDPDADLGLSRGTVFLKSQCGCRVQPKHADYQAFSVRRILRPFEKPASCIIALENSTRLHFFYGPQKIEEIVTIDEGDVVIFAGDLLHAGGAWNGSVANYRLFAYWPTDEFLVDWHATLAVGGSQRGHPNTFKIHPHFASSQSLLAKTNPISSFFVLESYQSYLFDSGTFYKFDSTLYLEGIAAHIDSKHDGKLPFVYTSAEIPVKNRKVSKCTHFPRNQLPKMPNEELHACVRRCVYCVVTDLQSLERNVRAKHQ